MIGFWFRFCRRVHWGTGTQLAGDRDRICTRTFGLLAHSHYLKSPPWPSSIQGNQCFPLSLSVAKLSKSLGHWPARLLRTGRQPDSECPSWPGPGSADSACGHQWHILESNNIMYWVNRMEKSSTKTTWNYLMHCFQWHASKLSFKYIPSAFLKIKSKRT